METHVVGILLQEQNEETREPRKEIGQQRDEPRFDRSVYGHLHLLLGILFISGRGGPRDNDYGGLRRSLRRRVDDLLSDGVRRGRATGGLVRGRDRTGGTTTDAADNLVIGRVDIDVALGRGLKERQLSTCRKLAGLKLAHLALRLEIDLVPDEDNRNKRRILGAAHLLNEPWADG